MPVSITICAQIMRTTGSLCLFFQSVSHNSRGYLRKFIFLLLSVPCFQVSHFFFSSRMRSSSANWSDWASNAPAWAERI